MSAKLTGGPESTISSRIVCASFLSTFFKLGLAGVTPDTLLFLVTVGARFCAQNIELIAQRSGVFLILCLGSVIVAFIFISDPFSLVDLSTLAWNLDNFKTQMVLLPVQFKPYISLPLCQLSVAAEKPSCQPDPAVDCVLEMLQDCCCGMRMQRSCDSHVAE